MSTTILRRLSLAVLLALPACRAASLAPGDAESIGAIIDDWNRAWVIEDPVLAASGYDAQADFTNAFGFHEVGRAAIEDYLAWVFELPFVMAGDSVEVERDLRVLAPGVVIVRSRVERTGQRTSEDEDLGTRSTSHLRVFTRGPAGWAITSHLISDARSTDGPGH